MASSNHPLDSSKVKVKTAVVRFRDVPIETLLATDCWKQAPSDFSANDAEKFKSNWENMRGKEVRIITDPQAKREVCAMVCAGPYFYTRNYRSVVCPCICELGD